MKSQFPLIEQLGLPIYYIDAYVRAADLEDLLRSAQMLYGRMNSGCFWTDYPADNDTHQCRMVLVEPRPPKQTPRDRLRHALNKAICDAIYHQFGTSASLADQRVMSETIQAVFDEVGE